MVSINKPLETHRKIVYSLLSFLRFVSEGSTAP